MDQGNGQFEAAPKKTMAEPKAMKMATTLAICSGGWLVPGLAHVLVGRWIRGLIFALCVLLMFGLGLAMHGRLYDLQFEDPLDLLSFVANIGTGIPYWIAQHFDWGAGAMNLPSFDYGTKYLAVCGLLNYLIILDAFDIAQGRKP
ncbi:MAG TPA: DUF6677 family protein [Terriglobia bacterium]|jgi:uncharacterized membrane protein YhaH (DUF805 family)